VKRKKSKGAPMSTEKKMSDIPVRDLTKAALLSGSLSDIHLNSMKMYPLVCFNEVVSSEMSYDIQLDRKSEVLSKISYFLEFAEGGLPDTEESAKRVKYLQDAVAALLWNEVVVEVFDKATGEKLG